MNVSTFKYAKMLLDLRLDDFPLVFRFRCQYTVRIWKLMDATICESGECW